jgi:hypothetical protein
MVAAVSPGCGTAAITAETMIPDLFREHPQTRCVFDRHGLEGCGGRLGPVESIGFFARAHGVDQQQLLAQIHEMLQRPATAPLPPVEPSVGDTIYRRYFLGGIWLILTAGATWGAWLLWQIGIVGQFTGVSFHHVNAHGHAQIYGWVGLFIMGFAYQAFPRIWHTKLPRPGWAVAAFVLMGLGLVVRTIGMTAHGSADYALSAAMSGGALEMGAIAIFITQMIATYRRGDATLKPYIGFIFAALFFFVAQGALDLWHTWMTMTAATREQLVWYVATYQAPLRDLQIHGLALFMILGVSLRMLPALFNVPEIPHRRAWWALGILGIAVVSEAALFIVYRHSGSHALAGLLMVPWLMLAAGCWMIAGPWKLWRPTPVQDRSAKFVRAAYGWLAVSLIMLLLLPVYQVVSQIPFSHAYYGAIRHAITVGFISLMIMGMAGKVVPTLNGVDPRTLPALWGPFLLINLGCFLRVSLQTLTDWHPGFFMAVGISGTLEVTALAWWGLHLARIMRAGKRMEREPEREEPAGDRPVTIEPDMRVTDVLRWFPETAAIFDRYGFTLLRNPVARRTVARGVTIEQAARFRGIDGGELLHALKAAMVGSGQACETEARQPCSAGETPAATSEPLTEPVRA